MNQLPLISQQASEIARNSADLSVKLKELAIENSGRFVDGGVDPLIFMVTAFVLAAFVNAIWDDSKAFQLLMKVKAFQWAACANTINGDEKAEEFLKKSGNEHFVLLAHAIQMMIHEDGDRNISPVGVMKNLFNFKKAFE